MVIQHTEPRLLNVFKWKLSSSVDWSQQSLYERPSISPDLIHIDFLLRSHMRDKIHTTLSENRDDLAARIREASENVTLAHAVEGARKSY
ncbi:hypothetical protein ANN_14344 [Periplaneta americana]|uniref:Uncharacterized protein n=1 Tax=Periplaneta americana TaxID=6978 RepID=A0ABQ8SW22_PERAM|nr:hypothetical protein ANN_14344 [Periplaneta americana]